MIPTLLGPLPPGIVTAVTWLAFAVTLGCVIPLCVLTWRRQADPSAITWGIWAAVGIVATIAMARGGAPPAAWLQKGALSLGPVAVAVVALWRLPRVRPDRLDRWCLALGVAGTIAYAFTGEGLVAVAAAMIIDAIGAGPTWRRAWRNPHGELITTYALALGSVLVTLAIITTPWTLLSAAYLGFLALQMASIIVVLALGRRRHTALASTPCADSVTTPVSRSPGAMT